MKKVEQTKYITFKDLYPQLSPEELLEAEENMNRYIELCLRIYTRIKADPQESARLDELLKEQREGKQQVKY